MGALETRLKRLKEIHERHKKAREFLQEEPEHEEHEELSLEMEHGREEVAGQPHDDLSKELGGAGDGRAPA